MADLPVGKIPEALRVAWGISLRCPCRTGRKFLCGIHFLGPDSDLSSPLFGFLFYGAEGSCTEVLVPFLVKTRTLLSVSRGDGFGPMRRSQRGCALP
jgi:hypothetical protein